MEIALQGQSQGIVYQGYDEHNWIQCAFEEVDVSGRNERYEFRCSGYLYCCGRSCCTVPMKMDGVPLWLVILLLALFTLLLLCILAALAWLFSRRQSRLKKAVSGEGYCMPEYQQQQRSASAVAAASTKKPGEMMLLEGHDVANGKRSNAGHCTEQTISEMEPLRNSKSSMDEPIGSIRPPPTRTLVHDKYAMSSSVEDLKETYIKPAPPSIVISTHPSNEISTPERPMSSDHQMAKGQRAKLAYVQSPNQVARSGGSSIVEIVT